MHKDFADVAAIYEKDERIKEDDINTLKKWIDSQPHLPPGVQDLQLLLFYHSCHYDLEATQKCIDAYYSMRSKIPMFFADRNVLSEELQSQLNVSITSVLPSSTPDDYLVFYVRLMDPTAGNYIYSAQVKMLDMSIQLALLRSGPKSGFIAVFDMEGTSFAHLFKINPLTSKKFVDYVQEALPVRLKAVHLINVNIFTAQFIALLRPFMKRHLTDLLHVHRNYTSLYEVIPKEVLPKELGGKAGTIKELHDAHIKNLEDHVDFFLADEELKSDETKRIEGKNSKSLFGIFN